MSIAERASVLADLARDDLVLLRASGLLTEEQLRDAEEIADQLEDRYWRLEDIEVDAIMREATKP